MPYLGPAGNAGVEEGFAFDSERTPSPRAGRGVGVGAERCVELFGEAEGLRRGIMRGGAVGGARRERSIGAVALGKGGGGDGMGGGGGVGIGGGVG